MHILLIPSSGYLQEESHLPGIFQQDQAHALKRSGCQIGIISPRIRKLGMLRQQLFGWEDGIVVLKDGEIPVYKLRKLVWVPRSYRADVRVWIQAGIALFKHYIDQQGKPDIIHAHDVLNAGLLATQLSEKFQIPYVITEHSSRFMIGKIPDFIIPDIKNSYKNANALLPVSPNLGSLLSAKFGSSFQNWEWVPNLLSQTFETQELPIRSDRRKEFRFLNVATLHPNKSHALLLEAFATQFRGRSEIQLRIGGEGSQRHLLEEKIRTLGIEQQVFFLGDLDRRQVLTAMQACDAFVLSSNYETFGVVLIEALACGKPVIATACGGPECMVNSGNGILVPTQNEPALGAAMVKIMEQINQYNPLAIRQDCIARFGEKAVVSRLLEIYARHV
ncbi:hypothetical protein BST81_15765 [Leptolyngbya sp. 'hensonii']|uniref:glycosyltransferase n=1 Tax=Leptolyngbya sp. 'hensonii' TaxID=1922337 RepID=UPI00094FEEB4|nr:glycosyltransferase [Leptolyngbya sp. 'hensonii']OLP17275.1 hypothetical protein BST81_15765 [Leptolyngbya sp. 'hensonii']